MTVERPRGSVLARVETVAPGDRIFTPRGSPDGYPVSEILGPYDDDTFALLYRRWSFGWENRAGDKMRASSLGKVECWLSPMRRGERLPVLRQAGSA